MQIIPRHNSNTEINVPIKQELTIKEAKEYLEIKKQIDAYYLNRVWNVVTFYFGVITILLTPLVGIAFLILVLLKIF
jgi:hypothetical protein